MTKLAETDWVRAGWTRLAGGGIDTVRVEALARDLGATKGSFYWHFADREALFEAMLDGWEEHGTASIIATVDASVDTDPGARFRLLIAEVFSHPESDGIEVGIRAWARHHDGARKVLARVDSERVAYVGALLTATGISRATADLRAAIIYRALVGDFTMHAAGSDRMDSAALAELANLALDNLALDNLALDGGRPTP